MLTPYSLKSIDKCQGYGHFEVCGSSLKTTPKIIDGIYTTNTGVLLLNDRQIQILVMWLIRAINKSRRLESAKHAKGIFLKMLSRDSEQEQSHDQLQI